MCGPKCDPLIRQIKGFGSKTSIGIREEEAFAERRIPQPPGTVGTLRLQKPADPRRKVRVRPFGTNGECQPKVFQGKVNDAVEQRRIEFWTRARTSRTPGVFANHQSRQDRVRLLKTIENSIRPGPSEPGQRFSVAASQIPREFGESRGHGPGAHIGKRLVTSQFLKRGAKGAVFILLVHEPIQGGDDNFHVDSVEHEKKPQVQRGGQNEPVRVSENPRAEGVFNLVGLKEESEGMNSRSHLRENRAHRFARFHAPTGEKGLEDRRSVRGENRAVNPRGAPLQAAGLGRLGVRQEEKVADVASQHVSLGLLTKQVLVPELSWLSQGTSGVQTNRGHFGAGEKFDRVGKSGGTQAGPRCRSRRKTPDQILHQMQLPSKGVGVNFSRSASCWTRNDPSGNVWAMICLDFNATTPVRPQAIEEMLACLAGPPGNPSSAHGLGRKARDLRETARERIARSAGCRPRNVVFTSGGTEADNLALQGIVSEHGTRGRHLLTLATEHEAVLHPLRMLEQRGFELTVLGVEPDGMIDPEKFTGALRNETLLVSVMAANNETGVLQDLETLGKICRSRGILFHTDAVQLFGKGRFHFDELPIDCASLSSHKVGGPKGAGCLLIREGLKVHPLFFGGGQERELRPGTENLPGIVGFGRAAEVAAADLESEVPRLLGLREQVERGILSRIPGAVVNGAGADRLPNTTHVSFPGVDGQDLLVALDLEGFAVSTGAACHSGATEPSPGILALGVPRELAAGSIRISLGWENTTSQVEQMLGVLPGLVQRLLTSATH